MWLQNNSLFSIKTKEKECQCIKHSDKWLNPSEFESLPGVAATKWKQSIKCERVEWLSGQAGSQDSQSVSHQLENEAVHSQHQGNGSPGACSSQVTESRAVG